MIPTVEWKEGIVRLLDQSLLPERVEVLECRDHHAVAQAIQKLKVRGAPAIGVAAALGVALGGRGIQEVEFIPFQKAVLNICNQLAATRPTAVNLFWALERMKSVLTKNSHCSTLDLKQLLVEEAIQIWQEDLTTNHSIGSHGANLIKDGNCILTHCNAGALATAGYGTALGVVRAAWGQGKKIHVYADETRPVLQGARLTTWELMQEKIPVTLITDSMAGALMRQGIIHLCLVGADRIAANGDVANKIGTYTVAVLAKVHKIPFFVAAPFSTIDLATPTGEQISIEQRPPDEVTSLNGGSPIAPKEVHVLNPAFDVTPADLVTAIITERGIFKPSELASKF